ncbi:hypothetical protein [Vibrio parahaemolyticus]|uniref:hypothetical protein n=1 Tax=Vibrio parahaemolyticus TaxID=670 RepID=UPI001FAC3B44|nr:hypothetical protein [Vibrio parahaemolyticus]MCI9718738.1 hypothetical protein [Vibrio parahaemolyticus]
MTMIVGLHLGDYVLVAADKRETYVVNGEVVSVISDNVNKLVDWGAGVVTGSGYVPLLSELKSKLSQINITTTDQILDLAKEISDSSSEQPEYWRSTTNWMFSYVANTSSGLQCRLGYMNCTKPEEIPMLHEMRATIWAKLPDLEEKIAELNSALMPLKSPQQFQTNFQYHLHLIAQLFEYGAKHDKSVCKDFDYFIQFRNGERFLSSEA